MTDCEGNELFINNTVFKHRQLDSGRYVIMDLRTNMPLTSVYHAYSDNREVHRLRTWAKSPIAKTQDMNTDFWSQESNRAQARFRPMDKHNCCDCTCCEPQTNYCPTCGSKLLKGDESHD